MPMGYIWILLVLAIIMLISGHLDVPSEEGFIMTWSLRRVAKPVIAILVTALVTVCFIYSNISQIRVAWVTLKKFRMMNLQHTTVDYGTMYNLLKISIEDSGAFSVCTPNDDPLINSDPRTSAGCQKKKQTQGITLMCEDPQPVMCNQSLTQAREIFFRNMARITAKCDGRNVVGNERADGVWRTCASGPYELKKNACLVYSFGINDEWSFDDTISQVYGCEIHAFDPSMNTTDHKRDDKITFHNMGVAGRGTGFKASIEQKWKMLSINNIIQLLGHLNRTIDILKVDIEYAEWDAFEDLLKTSRLRNVKQLVTELHCWTDHTFTYVRFYRILTAIENAGFEKWFISNKTWRYMDVILPKTGQLRSYYYQMDVSYINTKFL